MVDAVALTTCTPRFQDFLHLVKQVLVNNRGVSTGERLAFVYNETRVVRVVEHARQLAGS